MSTERRHARGIQAECSFACSNTSNLFLCGSPLGIFLHIDQAQIIPRKGRERTMRELMAETVLLPRRLLTTLCL